MKSAIDSKFTFTSYSEQSASGIDLSHLRANLLLSPTERLEKHRRSHELMMEVHRAAIAAGLRHNPSHA
jgi:hypothetical protein